jgi:EmrB/QacA subfamily drug resistance transporter
MQSPVRQSRSRHLEPDEPGGAEQSHPGRRAALAVLCCSLLVVSLDTTILNVALPTIADRLHATSAQLQWIVDAYSMVFGCLVLVGGSTADRYGRRLAFVTGLLVFGAGSLWSAFSGGVDQLIAARAVMGVGGALIMPATLAIITAMFRQPAERRRAIGLWSATTGVGVGIGPLVGGVLLAHFWWGSVFLVNVPIVALGAIAAVLVVPESRNEHARRVDLTGALLAVAGLGLVLWGLIEAPSWGWASAGVLAALAGGVALLVVLAVWEQHSSHPLLRLDLLRRPRFHIASISVGLLMFALVGAFFVLTQYLQFFLGYSPLQAGLRITPIAVLLAAASIVSPALVRRIGTKLVVAAGLGVCAIGLW